MLTAVLALLHPLAPLPALPARADVRVQGTVRAPSGAQSGGPAVAAGDRPSVVLIVADDLGVDLVGAYGEAANPPCTPVLDGLADGGILFRNAWANPSCSPTRAALLTGRFGFRTGIGAPITPAQAGLALAETTLPELLTGLDTAYVGKWHLAGNLGDAHPLQSGFGSFTGLIGGQVPDYFQWPEVVDGVPGTSTSYATTEFTDDAVALLGTLQEPFFLYLAHVAPHSPFHVPPAELCPGAECPTSFCAGLPPNPTNRQMGKAMAEAMDRELGRFLDALDAAHPDALVLFLGDNGTAGQLSSGPFLPSHAKGTVYEGGLNVPLIVRGPGVAAGAECAGLVCVTDVFATVAELAGVPSAAEDSVSLVPYLADPTRPSLRAWAYGETFSNGGGLADHRRAVRGERYKLLRQAGQPDELYDLQTDPFETTNLLPGPTREQQAALDELEAVLVALGVD